MVQEGFVISPPSIGGTVTSFSELPTNFDLKEKTPFGKASFTGLRRMYARIPIPDALQTY